MTAVGGWRAIPDGCGCTWRPDCSTVPATWRLIRTDPACKMHGESGDET